jgi:TctA family transporter
VIAARGSIVSGMMMSLLGCLVGMIGVDVSTGVSRFSLGQDFLYDGINFIALSVAMFAVAEIIYNHASHSITRFDNITVKFSNLIQHFRQIIKPAARGSIIGTLLGLLPGGGITISSYTAYAYESRYDKSLGTGSIGGVSSAEAANNASAHSGYIPLLSIGLPENAVMAIMLGAMMIMGVMPGPTLINEQSDVFWGIVVSMLVGNVLLLVLNVPMIKIWTSLLRIPKSVLYPMIFVLSTLAVYSARNNPADILVLAIISVIGYIMVALRLEAVSFIVGFILGPKFETMLTRSLTISGGDVSIFYTSWINILMLSVIIITLTYHIIKNRIINSNNNT